MSLRWCPGPKIDTGDGVIRTNSAQAKNCTSNSRGHDECMWGTFPDFRLVPYPEQIASMIFWLPDVLESTQAVVSSILPKIETFAHYMAIMALLLLGT